jgi:mannose-6-phosphate isomerase-like protein (cupin superfamily)
MPTQAIARGDARNTSKQQAYWFLGDLVIVHLSGEDTEGRFSLLEFLQPPDYMTPLHVHRRADQAFYVLEGELTFYLPGLSLSAGPGGSAYGPIGVPHVDHTTSADPARFLVVNSPAGFEAFVAAAGEPAAELTLPPPPEEPPAIERLTALAGEHEIELLGPPGTLP